MEALTDFVTFASEADELVLAGAAFLLLALIALIGDKRRARRDRAGRHIDKVGWVPWTTVFLVCVIIGGGLLALALPMALFGG